MEEPVGLFVGSFELTLWCAGVILLSRLLFKRELRAKLRESRLPAWEISVADFFLFLLFVIVGMVLAGLASAKVAAALELRGDTVTVTNGAAAQLGMLLGYFYFRARAVSAARRRPTPAPPPPELTAPAVAPPHEPVTVAAPTVPLPSGPPAIGANIFTSGLVTFLIAMPILVACVRVWEIALTYFGLPVDRQDLIGMFANAESPWMIAIMLLLAVVIAPITEELVFRAGLYRFLRTRIPRSIAIVVPALFFAALHVDWHTYRGLASLVPLLALAVIFSLAYEQTGRIGTVIVAHALFNLNTVIMIFGGAATE